MPVSRTAIVTPGASVVLQASGAPIIFMFHWAEKSSSPGMSDGCLSAFSSADSTAGSPLRYSIASASWPAGSESVAKPPRAETRSTRAPTWAASRTDSACMDSPLSRTITSPSA